MVRSESERTPLIDLKTENKEILSSVHLEAAVVHKEYEELIRSGNLVCRSAQITKRSDQE